MNDTTLLWIVIWIIIGAILGAIVTPLLYRQKERRMQEGVLVGAIMGAAGTVLLLPFWSVAPANTTARIVLGIPGVILLLLPLWIWALRLEGGRRPRTRRDLFVANLLDILPTALVPVYGVVAAIAIIILILQSQNADPQLAWDYLYDGTLASAINRADVAAFWMPLAITSFGLVLTYNSGLWNIGVEGQVIMGAIGATWAVRLFAGTVDAAPQIDLGLGHTMILLLCFVFGALAGGLWAGVAAVLKTRGGVNEIFGGVALNFVAQTFNMYLISNGGPWQPTGSRATETAIFAPIARLVPYNEHRHLSLTTIYITVGAFIVVALIMYISRWGLELRAMGKNIKSAYLRGIHTERNIILAMAMCGALAGLAGAFRVMGPFEVRAKLTANPSGGLGFLAILVVLLASMSIILTPLVSFVFAVLSKGGESVENGFNWATPPIKIDRSLVQVLQSTLVLLVVLAFGVRNRFFAPRHIQVMDDDEVART